MDIGNVFLSVNTPCLKSQNVPPLTCYSVDVHDPITIIFGRSVDKKLRNQTIDVLFSRRTYLYSGSALPCETGNPEIASYHFNIVCCFANKHTKRIQMISWSQLNQSSLWSPYVIGQTIIFSSCFFFLLSSFFFFFGFCVLAALLHGI